MSSDELFAVARPSGLGVPSRRAVLIGAVSLGALALAGCTVQPLYGSIPGSSGSTMMTELRAIKVDEQNSRVQQVLRNELIYAFTGGGDASPPRYGLRFVLSESSSSVAIESMSQVPAQIMITISVTFYLSDLKTSQTLLTGSAFANASYSFSSQRFANARALIDAENRGAKSVADEIRLRVASYFATHPAVK